MNQKQTIPLILPALLFLTAFLSPTLSQEGTRSALTDTIHIREVSISGKTERKLTGSLTGRIVLNARTASTLPAILGNTDLLKLLELTPGVQTAGDANTNMYIRGGDPGQNLLLYNETPIYSPGHLFGFFPLFNNDHLSSLELNKNTIEPQYGERLSSVIKVQSRKDIPPKPEIQGSLGLISSQLTASLPIKGQWAAHLSVRKTYFSLLMQPLLDMTINNKAENRVENPEYDFFDANLTLTGNIADAHSLQLDVFAGDDQLKIAEEEILLNGSVDWANRALSLGWKTDMGDDKRLSQRFFFSRFHNKALFTQGMMDMRFSSGISDWGYRNRFHFRLGQVPVETGLQYTYHDIQPQSAAVNNAELWMQGEPAPRFYAHDAAAFVHGKIFIGNSLTSEIGLRYTFFNSGGETFHEFSPRLSLRYRLREDQFLRASAGRQTQMLRLLSSSSVGIPLDFWVCASGQIPAQAGYDLSGGYYKTFMEDAYELSGDVFFRTMSNLSEYRQNYTTSGNQTLFESILYGKGKAYGLELMAKKNSGKLTGWLSYTLGRAERNFDDINQGKTFPAKFDRRHDISLVGNYSFNEKWEASLVYVYATGNAYTLPSSWYFINNTPVKQYGDYNGARMPDYNRTDLSIHYWFRKDNGINFSVYNLFMVNNPVYVFLNVKQDPEEGKIVMEAKKKRLATIIPSISWKFKF